MDIFLIDGIGPFFRKYRKKRINWSKIPFTEICDDPALCRKQFLEIAKDTEKLAKKVSAIGYNSISFDDVAHLATDPWLEPEINTKIRILQQEYRKLFAICTQYHLDIYLTMDVLSLTPALREKVADNRDMAEQFLLRQVQTVISEFAEIKGIILRIGECDGTDVKGVFNSELLIKTPSQANHLIRRLLSIFEEHKKYLILRTWTVGAYKVGDLIWHKKTSARVLHGINSPYFILSMKYGESDFFRYLPLNKHFFRLPVKKMIELQAKREYEGCGEYPSFIGWDYQEYAKALKGADNMAGMSVWCQTGGWVPFKRLTFLDDAGIWNELNSYVSIKIFRENKCVEEAITGFAQDKGITDIDSFRQLLKLNDEVIKELLYIPEVAEQKVYFRRVRVPPLMSVMWNNIFINDSIRTALRVFVEDGEESIASGYTALEKIREMEQLAVDLGLPAEDFRFMHDTFAILALAREYYFRPYDDQIRKKIKQAKRNYKKTYPKSERARYRLKTNYQPFIMKRRHLKWVMTTMLRKQRGYRILDHLFTLHLLGVMYRFTVKLKPKMIPKFARKQAMGLGTLFK